MNVGYARVSSKDQNLDRQIAALNDAGVERIFAETDRIATNRDRIGRPLHPRGGGGMS